METLPNDIRDCYLSLREEYSPYIDEFSATLSAFATLQRKHESPWDYYMRLKTAYFHGRNTPGLEEDHIFKCLFLHNLHESLRYNVTMHCRTHGLSMQDTRKYVQLAWETHRHLTEIRECDDRILGIQASENGNLALEGLMLEWVSEQDPRSTDHFPSKADKTRE